MIVCIFLSGKSKSAINYCTSNIWFCTNNDSDSEEKKKIGEKRGILRFYKHFCYIKFVIEIVVVTTEVNYKLINLMMLHK